MSMRKSSKTEKMLTVAEVATFSGYTPGRIKQLIWDGECQYVKEATPYVSRGFVYRIPESEAKRLADKRKAKDL
jgi:hypothetical protein